MQIKGSCLTRIWLASILLMGGIYLTPAVGQSRQNDSKSSEEKKALMASLQQLPSKEVPSIDLSGAPLHILYASSR